MARVRNSRIQTDTRAAIDISPYGIPAVHAQVFVSETFPSILPPSRKDH